MIRKAVFTLFLLIGIALPASCSPVRPSPTPEPNMPNPASVYCEQNGGKLELRQDASGGVAGICVFADGSECDEWAYFRSECKPGDTLATPVPTASPTQEPAEQIANPASENCVKQGGTLVIQKRGDGGEYGVCMFEDNRQCEEWAMLRGECPVGGVKITGYVTLAAQYCAITGGEYKVTGNSNTDQEQGTCTLKNGQVCDARDYFDGKCDASTGAGQSSYGDPFAYCAAVGTIDTPDGRYSGPKMPAPVIQAMIRQKIVSADAPLEFQQNAVWRCMNNSVWVCHFGANLPCMEKADTTQVPTSEMEDYCKTNPTADNIPAAVTGRATVYEWGCQEGKPQVIKQLFQSDPQGYLADFWYELTP